MSFALGSWLLLAALGPTAPAPRGALLLRHGGFVSALAFTPDGKTLISGSGDHLIRLWDATTGKERRRLAGHTHAVLSLALTTDGRTLASGSSDQTARLWDVAGGKERRLVKGHKGDVVSVALSPDGAWLASADCGYMGRHPGMIYLG